MRTRGVTESPLLGVAGRRTRMVAVAGAVLLVASMGIAFAGDHQPSSVDVALDALAADTLRYGMWNAVDVYFLLLGSVVEVCVAVALIAVISLAAGRVRGAVFAIATPAVAGGLTELVLKPVFQRRLDGDLSFPSGHLTAVSAVGAVVVILLVSAGPVSRLRRAACALVIAVVAASSVAVVAEGTHYATDVVGGWCVGVAVALLVATAVDAVPRRTGATSQERTST